MIVLGIDPGTTTGYAVWDAAERMLLSVSSCSIVVAMNSADILCPSLVIFEDARTMRVGGGKTFGQQSRLQGVGSVKRDSSIWEEYLEHRGIPYQAKRWCAGTTKWDRVRFERDTGWTAPTNEHGRDAAVIVYGLNLPMAKGIVQAWEQRKQRSIVSSSTQPERPAPTVRRRSTMPRGV